MKKILAILIAIMMVFALVACDMGDTPDNPNGDNTNSSQNDNPDSTQSGTDNPGTQNDEDGEGLLDFDNSGVGGRFDNVTYDNYATLAAELFGFTVTPQDGNYMVTGVGSSNKVHDFHVMYLYQGGLNEKELLQYYYDAVAAISTNGMCGQITYFDKTSVSKTEPYSDFAVFYDNEANVDDGYLNATWIYEYNGRIIRVIYTFRAGGDMSLYMNFMSYINS